VSDEPQIKRLPTDKEAQSSSGVATRLIARGCKDVAVLLKSKPAPKPRKPRVPRSAGQWLKKGQRLERVSQHAEALDCYRRGLELDPNHAELQYELGLAYRNGWVVAQDYGEAAAWFREAASRRHADAQSALGRMYLVGQGVRKDYSEAVAWFRKAAENGDDWAQCKLGLMYFDGEGVAQDYSEACFWYAIASNCSPNAGDVAECVYWRERMASKLSTSELSDVRFRVGKWLRSHPAKRQ